MSSFSLTLTLIQDFCVCYETPIPNFAVSGVITIEKK